MTTSDLHPTQDFLLHQRWDCPSQRACDGQVSGVVICPREQSECAGSWDSEPGLSDSMVLSPALCCPWCCSGHPPAVGLTHPWPPQPPPSAASSQEAWGLRFYPQLGRWARYLGLKRKERWTSPKPRVLLPVTSLSAKSSGTEGVGTARPWFSWAF